MSQEAIIEIMDDFSPLDSPVKRRGYTNHRIDEAELAGELEEPTYEVPSYTIEDDKEDSEKPKEEERDFNPEFTELGKKEKAIGAEMMAEMTLDIYAKACSYLGKIPQISEDKIDRLIFEGEIDSSIMLPTESGDVSIKEFATEYNSSIKEAFEVSDEFKEKVKAPLIRVFKKRGIGMTDEQLIAYYFITDSVTKGAQAFMLKKTANSIIDSLKENTRAIRETQPYSPLQKQAKSETVKAEPIIQEEEYTENIVDVVSNNSEKLQKPIRTTPKTNLEEQLDNFQHSEPEEVYSNLTDGQGFRTEFKQPNGMPAFGDKDILAELERLSSSSSPKKPVRKKPVTKLPKKK